MASPGNQHCGSCIEGVMFSTCLSVYACVPSESILRPACRPLVHGVPENHRFAFLNNSVKI